MASAGGDGILYLFSLYESTGTNIGTFESHLAPVTDVVLSTSGLRMVSGCKNGRLVFYRFDMDKKGWSVFHKGTSFLFFNLTFSSSRRAMPIFRFIRLRNESYSF